MLHCFEIQALAQVVLRSVPKSCRDVIRMSENVQDHDPIETLSALPGGMGVCHWEATPLIV